MRDILQSRGDFWLSLFEEADISGFWLDSRSFAASIRAYKAREAQCRRLATLLANRQICTRPQEKDTSCGCVNRDGSYDPEVCVQCFLDVAAEAPNQEAALVGGRAAEDEDEDGKEAEAC